MILNISTDASHAAMSNQGCLTEMCEINEQKKYGVNQ